MLRDALAKVNVTEDGEIQLLRKSEEGPQDAGIAGGEEVYR